MIRESDMNRQHDASGGSMNLKFFLLWFSTAALIYGLLSGIAVWLMPFGQFAQYSVLIHTLIGGLSFIPVVAVIYMHWRHEGNNVQLSAGRIAFFATVLMLLCILTGVAEALMALFGTWVPASLRYGHLVTGLLLGVALGFHLVPLAIERSRANTLSATGAARKYAFAALAGSILLCGLPFLLVTPAPDSANFQSFADDYDWEFGADRPFWPSRIRIAGAPWRDRLNSSLAATLDDATHAEFAKIMRGWPDVDGGQISAMTAAIGALDIDEATQDDLHEIMGDAEQNLRDSGAIKPNGLTGSDGCGVSGCHEAIYKEWQPSAHGFSATDVLFLRVQETLAESKSVAQTRACAGCHDPVALLSGTRTGESISGDDLVVFEGNSCLICHSTVSNDTEGNGGYELRIPDRYLFEQSESEFETRLSHFLVRSYPDHHVTTYKRPLYKDSEFCAACHKQTPLPGISTSAGLAQGQNEYDSWLESRWYHEDDEELTIECRECHMPLVDSDDPARGDNIDDYRHAGDGKHRSHRMLASNMYIPMVQGLVGGEEQAEQTIAWLRGEIEIPEIEYKWETGPVVDIQIVAPSEIEAGELVNLQLHLYNNKTGHDFPAGPLDVLESWVELTVEDNLGNVLMQLGNERTVSPSLDAPVIYKADWYDRQGLPIERHNLWEVVGESYRRTIGSGEDDIIDVPFQCPGVFRPRLSESASEEGPGERKSDVVFSIENEALTELKVTARLLFRKANPEFLAKIYDLDTVIEAPVVELNSATHTIKVSDRQ
jgi:hypothetical protein